MKNRKMEEQSEWDSFWEAYNELHELSRAEWTFVFIIVAISVAPTLIKLLGGA